MARVGYTIGGRLTASWRSTSGRTPIHLIQARRIAHPAKLLHQVRGPHWVIKGRGQRLDQHIPYPGALVGGLCGLPQSPHHNHRNERARCLEYPLSHRVLADKLNRRGRHACTFRQARTSPPTGPVSTVASTDQIRSKSAVPSPMTPTSPLATLR